MFPRQTRTDATETEYRKIAERIIRDFECSACGETLEAWFSQQCKELRSSTIRKYLAALNFYNENGKKIKIRNELIYKKNKLIKPRTSAKKRKSLPESIRLELEDSLWNSTCLFSKLTSRWLHTATLLGFRPGEGDSIEIIFVSTGVYKFIIRNSKTTNGRSTGECRTITLYNLGDMDLKKILEFLELSKIARARLTWCEVYRRCRGRLSKQVRALKIKGEKSITLYSARHQFAADLKFRGYSKVEAAAAMGHSSDRTAGTHYGRARVGQSRTIVLKADQAECKKVRVHDDRVFSLRSRGMSMGM